MSKLFQIAAQAAQRLAIRDFQRSPIGKILRASRRLATGRRGTERRLGTLIRELSSPEARRLLDELERVGPVRYGKQYDRIDILNRFLRLLGPLGDAIRRVIGAEAETRHWSKQQVQSAGDVIRAFGGEVLTQPGQPGYERGIEAAKRLLSEIAEPPPVPTILREPPAPPDRPTIGETGRSQRTLDAEEALARILTPATEQQEEEDLADSVIQTLGRGMGYDRQDDAELIQREILVQSSNVYSFVFQRDSPRSGILYVTFLAWTPGTKHRSGPGPTYAYYDVPLRKYHEFAQAATTGSAGGAVWDYLRVRGSVYQHQHQYRIVAGVLMQEGGVYVPRKATAWGLRRRAVPHHGVGRRGADRSSLPERQRLERVHRGQPNRGKPNRGEPNRGRP